MNKLLQRIGFTLFALLLTTMVSAQSVEAETDVMRSNGKIYVVMAVVITIVAGLFIYVVSLDRKISKLEKGR
jgi:uncharacterized membrane protein